MASGFWNPPKIEARRSTPPFNPLVLPLNTQTSAAHPKGAVEGQEGSGAQAGGGGSGSAEGGGGADGDGGDDDDDDVLAWKVPRPPPLKVANRSPAMVLNDYSMQAKFQVQIKGRPSRLTGAPLSSSSLLLLLLLLLLLFFLHT